jgi:dolichol-phosphate mannosyltransferase
MSQLLSVIIPARNEAVNLPQAIAAISAVLGRESIPFELVIVNDHSADNTLRVAAEAAAKDARVRCVKNTGRPGYGMAVRKGLEVFAGDFCAIFMADISDSPEDLVTYYRKMQEGYECVFGTRFSRQSHVANYPGFKLVLNRMANFFVQLLFLLPYNDVTNAFQCYSRKAIAGMSPLISCHFNLTVEMPLKAIIRGYSWAVVPIDWHGRIHGFSKWKLKETGSRYLFITLYLWLEKMLSQKDYYKQ